MVTSSIALRIASPHGVRDFLLLPSFSSVAGDGLFFPEICFRPSHHSIISVLLADLYDV